MADNTLPKPISELLSLGALCQSGITTKGADIGLLQWTTANFSPLVTALQSQQNTFDDKRTLTLMAFDALHTRQDAMRTFLLTGRKMLSVSWGEQWTTEWAQAGWDNHTTAVPSSLPALKAIGNGVRGVLNADPTYEVDTARIHFTSDIITDMLGALPAVETAVAGAKSAQKTAGDNRGDADAALRGAIRSLIGILTGLLTPNSPLWDDFGLNRPGSTVTPGQPAAPTLAKTGADTATATVPSVSLATYYRWKYKIVGVDPEFRFAGRTADPMQMLSGLPLTGTLEVICEAANEAGPGVASEVASLVLG